MCYLLITLHQFTQRKLALSFVLLCVLHVLSQLLDALQAFLLIMVVIKAAQMQTHFFRHSYEIDSVLSVIV